METSVSGGGRALDDFTYWLLCFSVLSAYIFWAPIFVPATWNSWVYGLEWNRCMRERSNYFFGGGVVVVTPIRG